MSAPKSGLVPLPRGIGQGGFNPVELGLDYGRVPGHDPRVQALLGP